MLIKISYPALLIAYLISIGNVLAQSNLQQLDALPEIDKIPANSNFFCNPQFRGQSNIIKLDRSSKIIILEGDIVLQNIDVVIEAQKIDIILYDINKKNFELSVPQDDEAIKVTIYTPLKDTKPETTCVTETSIGLQTDRKKEATMSASNLYWIKDNNQNSIQLSGKLEVKLIKYGAKITANKVTVKLDDDNKLVNLKFSENFKIYSLNNIGHITADLAKIHLPEDIIDLIGSVVVSYSNFSLFKSDKLSIGFGENKYLSTKNSQNNSFSIH